MRLSHSYSSIKMFENCPYRYYRQRILKDVKDESNQFSQYGERIHKMLELRLSEAQVLPSEASKYEPLCVSIERMVDDGAELLIEKELVLNENLLPTTWWAEDAWIRSKLDVLVVKGDTAVVMDWKTGKRNIDTFQLQLFTVQVFKHFPEVQKVKTSLVWLKEMAMDTEIYKRQYANALWTDVIRRIKRIHDAQENDVWPAKPSGLCRFCPARHDCPQAQL